MYLYREIQSLINIPYMYKISRDVNFVDFAVALLSTKFSSLKITNIRVTSILSNS